MVTVVIPLHNHKDWVNGAIDSVLSQDYPRKQVVVVDDGSSDGGFETVLRRLYRPQTTPTGVEPFQAIGQLLNYEVTLMACRFQQARGPSFARNFGIKAAWESTDLFCFLDSDDEYRPGKISRSVDRWLEDPAHIGVVYSDYDTVAADGLRLRQFKEPFSRYRLMQECLVNCDSLVSRLALEHCGMFDETLRTVEDFDLWLRVSERFIIVHLPESLVNIRVGAHSSSATVGKADWEKNYQRVMQKAQERMQQNGQ